MGEEGLIRREFLAPDWTPGPPRLQTDSSEPDPDSLACVIPTALIAELRTDHAGESGAVMIYRGILAVARDPVLQAFASEHLATESRHLACIERIIPARRRSSLLPLWRVAGWLTGALPAVVGAQAVYATIEAVETFVNRHYAAQTELIDGRLHLRQTGESSTECSLEAIDALVSVRELLEQCRLDEVAHRDDAAHRWGGRAGILLGAWLLCVSVGSEAAVRISRKL